MESTNFDLRIRRTPKGLLAEASVEGRKAKHESPPPFGERVWEDLVSSPFRDARPRGMKRICEEVEDVGRRLFEASFGGDVDILWQTSLLEASRSNQRVRLCLHLWDEEGISDWPWEWLYDPRRKSFLSVSVETPLVRYPAALAAARPLKCNLPLRILVVAASPPGLGRIEVQREWEALQGSLQSLSDDQVLIELLPKATLSGLQSKLREGFHVLHFIGHGFFDRDQRQGGLLFEDGNGGIERVTGPDLATLFRGRRALSLIVVNACEGARSDALAPSPGVAQSLALAGVPAVVAMQFKISDLSAITFASHFYEALAEGDALDVAVTEARQAMLSADRDGIEWGTPVLFLRSSDGRIIEIGKESIASRLMRRLRDTWHILALLAAGTIALSLGLRDFQSQDSPDRPRLPEIVTEGCPASEILNMKFVRIEPGIFTMGSKPRSKAEKAHEVTISKPFCMSEHEVTRRQWKAVMNEEPAGEGADDLPVTGVSWEDVQVFLERLGGGYRLATEAQWEHAARAGSTRRFHFGDDPGLLSQYGNCEGDDRFDGLAPVKSFEPNRFGLYDMHGNASEWVSDWYEEYPSEPVTHPVGPRIGEEKVRRGGSFEILANNCDAVTRNSSKPGASPNDVGFRLVRTPED